jgi:hypothetical protein
VRKVTKTDEGEGKTFINNIESTVWIRVISPDLLPPFQIKGILEFKRYILELRTDTVDELFVVIAVLLNLHGQESMLRILIEVMNIPRTGLPKCLRMRRTPWAMGNRHSGFYHPLVFQGE